MKAPQTMFRIRMQGKLVKPNTTTRSLCNTAKERVPLPEPPIKPWPTKLTAKSLISMMYRERNLDRAVDCFRFAGAHHRGFFHTFGSYATLIRRLAHARKFTEMESILTELHYSGIPCHEDVFVTVMRYYGLSSLPDKAMSTFLSIVTYRGASRTSKSLNCLLHVLAQNHRYDLLGSIFKNSAKDYGILPNVVTGNILVKALCNRGSVESAHKLLEGMSAMGAPPNAVTYTTLMMGHISRGDIAGAERMFAEITDRGWVPDTTTFTALIYGYVKDGNLEKAIKMMGTMEASHVRPNEVTYEVVITGYCNADKAGEALQLVDDMLSAGKYLSSGLCCKVIDSLCRTGRVDEACYVWRKLLKGNYIPDNTIYCTLLHWMCKSERVAEARRMFEEFAKETTPSLLAYNTLIAGLCEKGDLVEAAKLCDNLEIKGLQANSFTYNTLIKGFCVIGHPGEGVRILEEMYKRNCTVGKATYELLIDGMVKSGKVECVDEVLSMAFESKFISTHGSSFFVDKLIGDLDNGVTVLDKILSDHSS